LDIAFIIVLTRDDTSVFPYLNINVYVCMRAWMGVRACVNACVCVCGLERWQQHISNCTL